MAKLLAAALCAAIPMTMAFTGKAAAAPDKTLGIAIMSAAVNANGTIGGGAGVVAVNKTGVGGYVYALTFNRKVEECQATATADVHRTVHHVGAVDNKLYFQVLSGQGIAEHGDFQVIVFCAR